MADIIEFKPPNKADENSDDDGKPMFQAVACQCGNAEFFLRIVEQSPIYVIVAPYCSRCRTTNMAICNAIPKGGDHD